MKKTFSINITAVVVVAVAIIALGALGYFMYANNAGTGDGHDSLSGTNHIQQPAEQASFNKRLYSIDEPGSLWWIVNKNRPLKGNYTPADLKSPEITLRWASNAESMQVSGQIAPSLEEMDRAMKAAGLKVKLISGYRSEDFQKQLYDGYVQTYGQQKAERFSAKPGTSEHQTGLVVDLGREDGNCELEECFGETTEGKWLAANAHKYGFILRYPKDKEAVVGYMYEPWHFRYVGKELAAVLFDKNLTMEEFFEVD